MNAATILREGMEVLCKHCGGWHVLARNAVDAERNTAESNFLYFTDRGRITEALWGGRRPIPSGSRSYE
jgi:hypothetical protein